ncbi:MAG: hypothetical protein M1838_004536 [Thelocarpon superellum]|nr:MAG: hypothetical protein M1838_004536 [Thelocarpon superellum]
MKFRPRRAPFLFFLLPSLAAAASLDRLRARADVAKPPQHLPPGPDGQPGGPVPVPIVPSNPKIKPDVGTKDAPVDGLDGKPHAGPWVESGSGAATEKDKKKPKDDDLDEPPLSTGSKPAPESVSKPAGKSKSTSKDPVIPEVNDGVMDDPNRETPKKGTTGTEGGVSEKDRDRKAQEGQKGGKPEKKPDPPKEARPLPHSEETKIKETVGDKADGATDAGRDSDEKAGDVEKPKALGGLAKPADLPDTPHDLPPPLPPSSQDTARPASTGEHVSPKAPSSLVLDDGPALIQPLHSFALSLTMILASEVGDKTFLIAALMAMKHPRFLVFSAAFAALIAMTVLSAVLGHAVPTLIPKRFTSFLAAGLFLLFGARSLREGWGMRADENTSEEMKEVEMELAEKEHQARKGSRRRSELSPYVLEAGRAGTRRSRSSSRLPSPPRSPSSSTSRSPSPTAALTATSILAGLHNLFSLLLSPAWVQTFVMTFLGEWGDRSQIATIAMAAGQDYWWVTGGAVAGHAVCTAAAVIGGRAVAGRVSLRVVTLGGAVAFLAFGIIYLVEAIFYY